MEITPNKGGFEYRQSYISLVLPGDKDYRVRTLQTGINTDAQPERITGLLSGSSTMYFGRQSSTDAQTRENERGLALLKYLGEMETAGVYKEYFGLIIKDEFAGGHRGIIDIRV
jgi:hypothetical protein